VVKCAYRGDRIREIEEKWIDENVSDEKEKEMKKMNLNFILKSLGEKANCRFDAIPGKEFCIFHDPNCWRERPDEVRREFLKHLKEDEERFFVGFHLPSVRFPEVVEKDVHMELAKFHDELTAFETVFKGLASFDGATFRRALFYRADFLGVASFDGSVFSGRVIFRDSTLLPDLLDNCLDLSSYISFRNINFENSGKVVFDGCLMRRVSFIYTDLGRIEFRNVGWDRDFKVFDEKLFLIKIGKGRKDFIRECEEKLERILDVLDGRKRDDEIEREIDLEPSINEVRTILNELKKKGKLSEEDEKKREELENKLRELKKELRERIGKRIDDLKKEEEWNKIFEEVEKDGGLTFENVLAVYRGLRDNYDYYLKYEESGRFFINEMMLRRIIGKWYGGEKHSGLEGVKRKLSGFTEKFVMWVYEILALYGESYTRPILWAILVIITSSLTRPLWLWMRNPNYVPELSFIFKEVRTSILVFFQLYWDTRTLTIVERLLSIPILGTLILALRRKLERRVRH